MLHGRQGILDDILNIQIRPYLMQVGPQIIQLRVCEHDELHAGGSLVVVQLVVAGAVREEGVVLAAELGDHVAQGEDEAEDELLVVGGAGAGGGCGGGGWVGRRGEGGRGGAGAWGLGGGCSGRPAARVDALGWGGVVSAVGEGRGCRRGRTVAVEDVEGVEHHGRRESLRS